LRRVKTTTKTGGGKRNRRDEPHAKRLVHEYTYVYAAICPQDGVLDSLILPRGDAEAMSLFLQEVSSRHPDEYVIMVADGAGWHRANDLKIPENICLVSLPPYSPELNPVEHLWEEIREKWFGNEVFRDMNGVENQLLNALVSLENDPERVRSLAGFDWIINCL
jgi:transposase-like protein